MKRINELNEKVTIEVDDNNKPLKSIDAFSFPASQLNKYENFDNCIVLVSNKYIEAPNHKKLTRKYIHIEYVQADRKFNFKSEYNGIQAMDIFVIPIESEKADELIPILKELHNI